MYAVYIRLLFLTHNTVTTGSHAKSEHHFSWICDEIEWEITSMHGNLLLHDSLKFSLGSDCTHY